VNVATGFGYEVYGLGRAGLSHGVDLAKAAGSFGYWVVAEGTNPFAIMADPEGWLKGGASKFWSVHTTGFWGAAWAATELAPMGGSLEAGPYGKEGAFGGEQRPWPWQGGAKTSFKKPSGCYTSKHPLKGP
jgi:hypothetical protein